MSLLSTDYLSIGYIHRGQRVEIQKDLNLSIKQGELICLIGPNGTGKSTLLKTLSGLLKPLQGKTYIDKTDIAKIAVSERAQLISLVLTDRVDIENATVHSVVAMGRMPYSNWWGKPSPEDEQMIINAVQMVHLEHKIDTLLSELSDGERQRVMIAKAFVQDTPIIFLDEPTAHLDLPNRVEILLLLHRMAHENGKAILMSTHELDMALQAADRIWLMTKDGVQTGVPEDLVLNGVFSDAFMSQHYFFNPTNGNFSMNYNLSREVEVHGDKTRMYWTLRALARAGYAAVEKADSRIIIDKESWLLDDMKCETINDLLRALEIKKSGE
jgi:iron complex transport system ATP-binding protein